MICFVQRRYILTINIVLHLNIIPLLQTLHNSSYIDLCQTNGIMEINMNTVLDIPNNATRRFNKPIKIYRENGLAVWTITPSIVFMGNSSCKHELPNINQDLSLAVELLQAEIFIDVEPDKTPMRRVCGTVNAQWVYGTDIATDELCIDFQNYRPFAPEKLLKLRFSQPWGESFKIFEYYEDVVIVSGIMGSPLKYLLYLEFFHNYTGQIFLNLVNVALHTCYELAENDDGEATFHDAFYSSIWPRRDLYHRRVVYHRSHNLCDSIHHQKGCYNINYHDKKLNKSLGINDLRITRSPNKSGHQLTLTLFGDFRTIDHKRKRSYLIFHPVLYNLKRAFNGLNYSIVQTNEFTITKSIYNQRRCNLTLFSLKGSLTLIQEIYAHEKFNLTQSKDGIKINISSLITSVLRMVYPEYLLIKVSCDIQNYGPEELKLSPNPQLEIAAILKNCSSDSI